MVFEIIESSIEMQCLQLEFHHGDIHYEHMESCSGILIHFKICLCLSLDSVYIDKWSAAARFNFTLVRIHQEEALDVWSFKADSLKKVYTI